MKISKTLSITLICMLLGLTLAWQYQSVRNNQQVETLQQKREDELIAQLLREKENTENLRKKYDELSNENRKYENSFGDLNDSTKRLQESLDKVRMITGLTSVKGKGVVVTFSKEDADSGLIRDENILDVLNELRASDAQAIAINDERIVAMSEVRIAGSYIVVNGKQMVAPFVIKVIADPSNVENALNMMNGVVERLQFVYQMDVKVEKPDSITIPKVREEVIKTNLLNLVEK
jgi:uncharacterized protein YlxW (UPF0749 family)